LIQLAFELGKTVDELETADQTWISRMLLDQEARAIANAAGEVEFHRRIRLLYAESGK
jgi:hypothetical protein